MILLKNLYKKVFLKNINEFTQLNIICFYAVYISLIFITSIVFYKYFIILYPQIIDNNLNIVYESIPFAYGELIENLIVNKKYSSSIFNTEFYLNRLPVVPFIFFMASFFSSKLYFLIISKNILFFSILFFTILKFSRERNYKLFPFLILNLIFLYNFYNLKIIYNFVYADFIVAIFLPLLFIISISNFKFKYFYIGLIIFILYLSKANMFPICLTLSLYFLFFEKKKIPLIFMLISILSWGLFGYIKTNKFPFGATVLSTNSHALSLSFNKNFHKVYPLISVDVLDKCHLFQNRTTICKNLPNKIDNEWEYYNFYKEQNQKYFEQNKKRLLKDVILKIKTIFFNFYEDGQIYKINEPPEKNFDIFIFINKLIVLLAIIIALKSTINNSFKISNIKIEIIFFIILFSSLPPFLLGWAVNRHLVFLFLLSHIYLFLKFKLERKIK